jgi:hypothetical protein
MRDELIMRLAAANPVPYDGPLHLADPVRLRPSWRLVLGVAVATAALVGAGVAIAAGFGAFNGISAAQNTKTGADVLPPAILAQVKQMNAQATEHNQAPTARFQMPLLLPDTARVIGTAPDGFKVYGLTDTHGDLCLFGAIGSCGPPLSTSHPITAGFANPSPTTGGEFDASGVAMDGVASVSFTINGKDVAVPVKSNVWIYTEPHSHAESADCIRAHFADGSTVNPFPEVPCP